MALAPNSDALTLGLVAGIQSMAAGRPLAAWDCMSIRFAMSIFNKDGFDTLGCARNPNKKRMSPIDGYWTHPRSLFSANAENGNFAWTPKVNRSGHFTKQAVPSFRTVSF